MKNSNILIVVFVLLFYVQSYAQQDTLLYKAHFDYYSPHVKSTILTKDFQFLKDGYYTFKGSPKDFSYVLEAIITKKDRDRLQVADTLYFSGEINDSIKVKQWNLHRKSDLVKQDTLAILPLEHMNFRDGKINTSLLPIDGKYRMYSDKKMIYFYFRNKLIDNGMELLERSFHRTYRKNDSITYKRDIEVYCENRESLIKEGSIYQRSNFLDAGINTTVSLIGFDEKKKKFYGYYAKLIEVFHEDKLTAITISYKDEGGKKHFEKLLNIPTLFRVMAGNMAHIGLKCKE
ncbi:MAG: hypothetical protein AB8B65_08520 [Kordia sp.]|uniref:hypothetical protein n=1 Tax=Kordia sp. TaxID=1965332 RepID=UPI00385A1C21